ncbi:Phospholipid phosphatase 6 [Bulinus truncatus]|nr:Phospholipid phosphatase 6 [Bulinus truncatus]
MRKRPIGQKVDDSNTAEEETATQVCKSACLSLWDSFLLLDQQYSAQLAVCATKESSMASMRPFMKLLEISCHGIPWVLGALVLFFCSHKPSDIEIAFNMLFALIFDLLIVGTLKMVFQRSRPSHNVMDMFIAPSVDKFSFPSGHTTRAVIMGLFLCFNMFTNRLLIFVTCVWALSVSVSRVLLGRHHIFDVLCGIFIGLLSYYFFLKIWVSQQTILTYLDSYFGHVHL